MQDYPVVPHPKRLCRLFSFLPFLAALAFCFGSGVQAQTASAPNAPQANVPNSAPLPDAPSPHLSSHDEVTVRRVPRNFLEDQAAIWTSPVRLRTHDLKWIVPLAAATGVALGTDHYVMTQVVSKNPSFNQASINASNAMVYSLVASPVVLYGFGYFQQDDHAREAGILTSRVDDRRRGGGAGSEAGLLAGAALPGQWQRGSSFRRALASTPRSPLPTR